MSEKVLRTISVARLVWHRFGTFYEVLCFTADAVVVARTACYTAFPRGFIYIRDYGALEYYGVKKNEEKIIELSAEEILKIDKNNFVIPNSEIKKVELRILGFARAKINVTTNEKKYEWFVRGIPSEKSAKIEDYERILRSFFLDKLSVSN
jgi:hypothetical protein